MAEGAADEKQNDDQPIIMSVREREPMKEKLS